MMAVNAALPPAGAAPTGPDRGGMGNGEEDVGSAAAGGAASGVDPIFQGEERDERPAKRATLLFQFFLFPLLIAAVLVGVLVLANLLSGGTDREGKEYLSDLASGGDNVQKQAAHQLAVLIAQEREKERAGTLGSRAAFYRDPAFRDGLLAQFEASFPEKSVERRQFLAEALGAVGDPSYAKPLADHLKTASGAPETEDVRRAIAEGLANLAAPSAVPYLAVLAHDEDVVVANTAVVGLAAVRPAESTDALRQALGDPRFEVRVNAAAGLARRGIDAGLPEIERTLDPAALEGLGIRTTEARANALVNAILSVLDLRVERLKPKVEALTKDGDARVRDYARRALDKWSAAK